MAGRPAGSLSENPPEPDSLWQPKLSCSDSSAHHDAPQTSATVRYASMPNSRITAPAAAKAALAAGTPQ